MIENALLRTLEERKIEKVIPSNQGIDYTSVELRKIQSKNQMIQSMSRKGNCYDNAVAESFFQTLHGNFEKFKSIAEAKLSIFDYIELFYIRKRLHSSIGYKSPVEFENMKI